MWYSRITKFIDWLNPTQELETPQYAMSTDEYMAYKNNRQYSRYVYIVKFVVFPSIAYLFYHAHNERIKSVYSFLILINARILRTAAKYIYGYCNHDTIAVLFGFLRRLLYFIYRYIRAAMIRIDRIISS